MDNDLGSVVSCLVISVICVWCVLHCGSKLREQIKKGTVVDQTLSEFKKEDAPNMFVMQVVGFVILIGASGLIGIGAIVVFFQRILVGH
jgi:hypothetical protein